MDICWLAWASFLVHPKDATPKSQWKTTVFFKDSGCMNTRIMVFGGRLDEERAPLLEVVDAVKGGLALAAGFLKAGVGCNEEVASSCDISRLKHSRQRFLLNIQNVPKMHLWVGTYHRGRLCGTNKKAQRSWYDSHPKHETKIGV